MDIITGSRDADYCSTYLRKGNSVYVEGRFRTRTWNDKNNVPHFVVEVIASTVKSLEVRAQQGVRPEIDPSVDRAFQGITPPANVPSARIAPLTSAKPDSQGNTADPLPLDDVF